VYLNSLTKEHNMDCIEIDLIPVFISISEHAWDAGDDMYRCASCENALLALEAARVGMPVEDFTAKYNAWMDDDIPF